MSPRSRDIGFWGLFPFQIFDSGLVIRNPRSGFPEKGFRSSWPEFRKPSASSQRTRCPGLSEASYGSCALLADHVR